MAPKRSFVPIFLLLSFSALILFSLHQSSLPSSSQNPIHPSSPTFKPLPNPNPKTPNFTLTIKVLAFDRLASLSRCLRSLANADYSNERVNLHVYIDHFRDLGSTHDGSVNLDLKLNESRQILDFVDGFSWKFGEKMVHYRTGNVGLQAQWLEAWWPSSDDEFVFVVEDDLEVSPLYYRFIKGLIGTYYYNASNFSPWIYGASLQRPRFVPGKHGNKIQLDSEARLFLYQLVGTWGQLLFPRPWKEFRLWYDTHKAKGIKPILQGMVTTGWYKKMGERIWTPWFIKFLHSQGYFNIYTNFLHERALSVSHRDAGVNYGKTAGPDSYLLDNNSLDFNLVEMQPLSNLKWYDFCFREVLPDRVVRSFDELGSVLHSVQKSGTIILVSLHDTSEPATRNMLCHFERLNIRNYIFMGPNSEFQLDLARRGHPVINEDQLFESIRARKSIGFQESSLELMKKILVKAYIIKKSLDLNYNTWVLNGNMLPLRNNTFLDSSPVTNDFYVGKIFGLLFVRSSSLAWKIWTDDFMYKVAKMAESSVSKESSLTNDRNFVTTVANILEQKGVKIKNVDEMGIDMNTDTGSVNQTLLGDGKKMVIWSYHMGFTVIQKQLENLGFWIVDTDFSCTAVVCYQS